MRRIATGLGAVLLTALSCGILDWIRLLRMAGAADSPLREVFQILAVSLFYYAFLGVLAALALLPLLLARPLLPVVRLARPGLLGVAGFLAVVAAGQSFVWAVSNVSFIRRLSREDPALWMFMLGLAVSGIALGFVLYLVAGRMATLLQPRALGYGLAALAVFGALSFSYGLLTRNPGAPLGVPVAEEGGPPTAPTAGTASGANVILITIETTRADHVNFMGYSKRETTPHLDRIASEGVVFEQAFTPAPWTRPTMASLFTSLYPSQHGLLSKSTQIADEVKTLPEILNHHGYNTVSFYANSYASSPSFGFAARCGRFEKKTATLASLWIDLLAHYALRLALRVTLPWDQPGYNHADLINGAVMGWLEKAPPTPAFVHVHYVDPHEPYVANPARLVQWDPRARWNLDNLLELYDGEIRRVDSAIAALLAEFERAGWLEGALLIITADHGEEFLDHGGWGHRQSLYNELLHVPLIVHAPGRLAAGERIAIPVSLIDVAPTVLDYLGLEVPPSYEGVSLLQTADGLNRERPILSERDGGGHNQALIQGEWKLIRSASGSSVLYNRNEDPAERNDRSREQAALVALLEARTKRLLAALEHKAPGHARPGADELRQLRTLGYTE